MEMGKLLSRKKIVLSIICGMLCFIILSGFIIIDLLIAVNSFNNDNVKTNIPIFTAKIREDYGIDFNVSLEITIDTIGILPRSIRIILELCEQDVGFTPQGMFYRTLSIPGTYYMLYTNEFSYRSVINLTIEEDIATSAIASHLSLGGNVTFYLLGFITLKWNGKPVSQLSTPTQTVTVP